MNYQRPPGGFRFASKGVNLRSPADLIPPDKYSCLKNVRSVSDQTLQTRPGYVSLFTTSDAHPITDIKSYATLGTDSQPRFLARNTINKVYLDTGALVATLAGGSAGFGACMIPFRPPASPQSWMYVTNGADYQKLSAPDAGNNVTAQNVGIAEPYSSHGPTPTVGAVPIAPTATDFTGLAAAWTSGGTAVGNAAGSYVTDTTGTPIADPLRASRYSIPVTDSAQFLVGMEVFFSGAHQAPIQDVLPACAAANVTGAFYYVGATGGCQISLSVDLSSTLRRGSIVTITQAPNSENLFVQSCIQGPGGTCCIETSTVATYTGGTIAGVPAIIVDGTVAGTQAITSPNVTATMTVGTGYLQYTLASNPFAAYTQDDYVHLTLLVTNLAQVTTVNIIFDTGGSGAPDYASSILTYSLTGASLAAIAVAGGLFSLQFPISALLGFDGMPANVQGIRVSVTTAGDPGAAIITVGSIWVGGGGFPDIGDTGIPYRYRSIPRSSLTGAQGNSTATMRYGVSSRRQEIDLTFPSAAYDSQIDTWDEYRYGGSLTSYRYTDSALSAVGTATDDVFDDTAQSGAPLPVQNYEPWPSIDSPYRPPSASTTAAVVGTWVTLTAVAYPATITRWLPGTLVQIGGSVFTLRCRPFASAGNYVFEIEENGGVFSSTSFVVNEPIVARQVLPYLWGPDDTGTIFGSGDSLRPGVLYYSAANNLDAAPQTNIIELCPPSEPLMKGAIFGGMVWVPSSSRWWALYSAFLGITPYTWIERDIGKAQSAPFAICSDGLRAYFWPKDCIAATNGGGYEDLTSDDLLPLFPHEGVVGINIIRSGVTFYAPDYSRAATFRLNVSNNILRAIYQDSTGTYRILVCDLRTKAWSTDVYHDSLCSDCVPDQPSGTLTTAPSLFTHEVFGDIAGKVWGQQDAHNDNGSPIPVVIGTFEWDGGDERAQPQWGDVYLDCLPASAGGISATPVSQGAGIEAATVIPQGTRTFAPVSVGGESLQKSLGLLLSWTDDFTSQSVPSQALRWGLSEIPQPEITTDRFDDWTETGTNRFWQGLILDADTFNLAKSIKVRDSDSLTLHILQPATATHNGRQTIAYSFVTPFWAHSVRLEPQDVVPWRKFSVQYVNEATPESVQTWKTQASALGLTGYMSLLRIEAAWAGSSDITLAISSFDGQSPSSITLPSTAGAYEKTLLTLTANKGQLFTFNATSSKPFQLFLNDWVVWVAPWGRMGPATPYRNLGGPFGDKATI